jgi:hypothetical protein
MKDAIYVAEIALCNINKHSLQLNWDAHLKNLYTHVLETASLHDSRGSHSKSNKSSIRIFTPPKNDTQIILRKKFKPTSNIKNLPQTFFNVVL